MSITEIIRGAPKRANEAYLALVARFPLRKIHTREQFDTYVEVMDRILDLRNPDEQTL